MRITIKHTADNKIIREFEYCGSNPRASLNELSNFYGNAYTITMGHKQHKPRIPTEDSDA